MPSELSVYPDFRTHHRQSPDDRLASKKNHTEQNWDFSSTHDERRVVFAVVFITTTVREHATPPCKRITEGRDRWSDPKRTIGGDQLQLRGQIHACRIFNRRALNGQSSSSENGDRRRFQVIRSCTEMLTAAGGECRQIHGVAGF